MNYIELNERIITAFTKKLNGLGRVDKINPECEAGLAYSLMVMERIMKYYDVIDDDKNRRANRAYFKTVRILSYRLNGGSNRIDVIEDENIKAGIRYALSVMAAQRKYLYYSRPKSKPKE